MDLPNDEVRRARPKRRNAVALTPSNLNQEQAEQWMQKHHPELCELPLPPLSADYTSAGSDLPGSPLKRSRRHAICLNPPGQSENEARHYLAQNIDPQLQAVFRAPVRRRNAVCLNPPNQTPEQVESFFATSLFSLSRGDSVESGGEGSKSDALNPAAAQIPIDFSAMGQSSWNPRFLELLEKAPHPSDRQRSSWNFYSPAYAAEDLENLAVLLIEETGLVQELNIDRDALRALLHTVRKRMDDGANVPYHNWYHVMDVFQATTVMVSTVTAVAHLPNIKRFAVILAALLHDLEHPGRSNAFLTQDDAEPLVHQYGTSATLETMHAALADEILQDAKTNVLSGLSESDAADVRASVRACILATDMAQHKNIIEELERVAKASDASLLDFSSQEQKPSRLSLHGRRFSLDRLELKDDDLVLKLILKCADLSNCTRPAAINDRWVGRLMREFNGQGLAERERGYKLTPGMGPEDNVPKGQVFFYSVICKPLFDILLSVLPETLPVMESLHRNISRWQGMVDAEEAAAIKQETVSRTTTTICASYFDKREHSVSHIRDVETIPIARFSD